ncbi:MAG: transcriptional repressor [Candidatus Omnitrophica bacterium]|nr:transcriptional repressor [Candidatus Omnitrophota bacterium]
MEILLTRLKANRLKQTPKRKAVLKLFLDKKRFLSPEEVFAIIKKEFKKASLPSIYRNLDELYKIGILLKVQKPDRRLYYALCTAKDNTHHHHIVCVKCGKIGEFKGCALMGKKKISGFKILDHSLQLEGVCNECD